VRIDGAIVSRSGRKHRQKQPTFVVAGSPWHGLPSRYYTVCGLELLDPEHADESEAPKGECRRCFR
jgi:hypothetical protein